MTFTIELSDDAARRVRELAEAERRTPEEFVRRQIESSSRSRGIRSSACSPRTPSSLAKSKRTS